MSRTFPSLFLVSELQVRKDCPSHHSETVNLYTHETLRVATVNLYTYETLRVALSQ